MPGIEAERNSEQITLLAYVQDKNLTSWSAHDNIHELERRALDLAVAGVDQKSEALRDLLEEKLIALREALRVEHDELDRRSEERDRAAREVSELRTASSERWIKDVMDKRWENHRVQHDASETALNDKLDAWAVSHLREHELIQLAVDKASASLAVRLEGMNEFRAQLDRMVATLVTLDILDVRLGAITQRLDKQDDIVDRRLTAIEQALSRNEGKGAGLSAFWGYLIGGIGLATAVLVLARDLLGR